MDNLLLAGMTYRTAGIDLRGRLARLAPETPALLAELADLAPQRAILRTCGRFELYVAGCSADSPGVIERLSCWAGLPAAELQTRLLVLSGAAAARHLLEVAAGLDSRIVGEDQVLAQVRGAHRLALQARCCGPELCALFQTAIHTGREVRGRTALGAGCASLAQAAVRHALEQVTLAADDTVIVLGTGLMAQQTVHHLAARGVRQAFVVSHHLDRALRLAGSLGLRAAHLSELPGLLPRCRVLLSCTSTQRHVLTPGMLAGRVRRLLAIDLGLPRTLDPACAGAEQVTLRHLDQLPACKAVTDDVRQRAAALVEKGSQRLRLWCGGRRAARHIGNLLRLADGREPRQARAIRRALHSRLMRLKEHAA